MEYELIELTDQQKKARRFRNIAIGLLLGALSATFFLVTYFKFGAQILERSL